MKIAIASAEMVPYVKVGGLADVIGALPRELAGLGHDVRVILPKPPGIDRFGLDIRKEADLDLPMAAGTVRVSIETAHAEGGVTLILVRHDPYFDRPNPYVDPKTGADWPDNEKRFALFSKAIVGICALGWVPDVIHLNDYQTGMVPILIREEVGRGHALDRTGIVYTIHNMGYQGIFPPTVLEELGAGLGERFFYPAGPLEYWGKVNFMKAAILYADLITTVSERYAREIQEEEHGCGLDGVLRTRAADTLGILNGIDTRIWNPMTDPLIPAAFGPSDLGPKRENRARLLQAMELPENGGAPVIGMISRLVDQKGFDLLEAAADDLMSMDLKLVVLGSGLPKYEALLRRLRERHPDRVGVSVTFSDPLAHLIEAGSDFFLMPSRYEPCGLNQMYSLRYGTIPIVRDTGGLSDTVQEYDPKSGRGNGFVFEEYEPEAMMAAIRRGLDAFKLRSSWKKLQSQVMRIDFSWARAASKYVETYQRAITMRR